MRLRQVALVARELDPSVKELSEALKIEVAYNDPGVETFGLRNALLPIGDTFLEVISPLRDGTTAGRYLDRRGGDYGYMAIFQTDDLEAERARLDKLGVRIVWEAALEDAATLHLHPRDIGGAIVSLDSMQPPESWRWAGGTGVSTCAAMRSSRSPAPRSNAKTQTARPRAGPPYSHSRASKPTARPASSSIQATSVSCP